MAKSRRIGKKGIIGIFAFLLFLLGLLFLFSSFTHLRHIAYPLTYAFGIVGFYGVSCFLIIEGLYLLFLKYIFRIKHKISLIFGLLILFFGLVLLASSLVGGDVDAFIKELGLAFEGKNGGSCFDLKLGGGFVGFYLVSLINTSNKYLGYVISGVVLLLGLTVLFMPLIVKGFKWSAKRAKEKAEEKERLEKEKETVGLKDLEASTPMDEEIFDVPSPMPELSLSTEEETPLVRPEEPVFKENTLEEQEVEKTEETLDTLPIESQEKEDETLDFSFSFTRAGAINIPKRVGKASVKEAPKITSIIPPEEEKIEPGSFSVSSMKEAIFYVDGEPTPKFDSPVSPSEASLGVPKPQSESYVKPPMVEKEEVAIEEPLQANEPLIAEEEALPVEEKIVEEVAPAPVIEEINEETPNLTVVSEETLPSPKPVKKKASVLDDYPDAKPLPPYKLPPWDLIKDYRDEELRSSMEGDCIHNVEIINQTFADFGVGARVTGYTIGPSVTRYEITTDRDVSVTEIPKVIPDIRVRLKGVSVRFSQNIAGSTSSGLEVTNKTTIILGLKDALSSLPPYEEMPYAVPFGIRIDGTVAYGNIVGFPHMLIGGTTGSGKSVFLHQLIMTLLMRNRPEDLKMAFIDPKRVELSKYNDIPHLLCPVMKEPKEALFFLKKLNEEMDRRFKLIEAAMVSNIKEFNEIYAIPRKKAKLPEIVVVMDEFGKMISDCKEIAEPLFSLASLSRACGINIILATQRPDSKLLTGNIKTNLPVKVALRVKTAIDSNIILDEAGAENLANHGDMLVDCADLKGEGLVRCQGCMIDTGELIAVTDFIRSQAPASFDPNFIYQEEEEDENEGFNIMAAFPGNDNSDGGGDEGPSIADLRAANDDQLYPFIKSVVMGKEYCSISSLERDFNIGFRRAGKFFRRLVNDKIIDDPDKNPSSGKGTRVLIHNDPGAINPGSVSSVVSITESDDDEEEA